MIVAQITKDHIFDPKGPTDTSQKDRIFESEALRQWWGWGLSEGTPEDTYFQLAESNDGRIPFKLYDDDNELYYEGWLINDDECLVQQFVLEWGKAFAGCTTIKVHKANPVGWVQEIG